MSHISNSNSHQNQFWINNLRSSNPSLSKSCERGGDEEGGDHRGDGHSQSLSFNVPGVYLRQSSKPRKDLKELKYQGNFLDIYHLTRKPPSKINS
mmetsp:Transcript_10930/g.18271  ORF Transcript_10930/g.18271 Transcript_10930/m.18271 type:complete len:95 (-) Transcript_10930:397-681(-)